MTARLSRAELTEIESLVGAPSQVLAFGGAYEGAAMFDKQIAGWAPPLQSADMDLLPDKDLIDARSRDLGRNDAYVAGGASFHKDSVVGSFFMLNAKPILSVLGKSEEWGEAFQQEVEEKFTLWAESPKKWVDAARRNDFTALIRLAVGVYTFGGEVLATVEWPKQQQREYKTAIQMIDPDRLSTPSTKRFEDRIRGGIKLDAYGAPVSAYIRTAHPRDYMGGLGLGVLGGEWWKEVPFEKPWGRQQVIHLLEQQRPEQNRGVSELVAGLREIAITRKFRDVTLQNAVVNAMYAASIESELPSSVVYEQMGAGNTTGAGVVNYAAAYLNAVNAYVGSSKNMAIDGVKVPHLFPGTKLQMRPAGTPGGVGQDFETSLLRYTAASLNISYEELSRDFSKVNYSSARAAMMQTARGMASRKRYVADGMATAIYRLWMEEAINNDKLDTFRAAEAGMLYTDNYLNMAFDALTNAEWIGAGRGQIDELKETQAAVLRIKYGLSTHEDELSKLGKDWRRVYIQLEREKNERDERGIVLLEDNSVNAASGAPRDKSKSDQEADADDAED